MFCILTFSLQRVPKFKIKKNIVLQNAEKQTATHESFDQELL